MPHAPYDSRDHPPSATSGPFCPAENGRTRAADPGRASQASGFRDVHAELGMAAVKICGVPVRVSSQTMRQGHPAVSVVLRGHQQAPSIVSRACAGYA